jgi:hypothetical protein
MEEDAETEESVHLNALFDGEEISEEFKEKTATIFEAAVAERVEEVRSEFSEAFEEALAENVEAVRGELVEHLDSYLNYVVEKFMEENKIEIESGLNNEIAESFMAGLRNLFVEHNIDVPEDKVDFVDSMEDRIAELEAELDEHINQNMEMTQRNPEEVAATSTASPVGITANPFVAEDPARREEMIDGNFKNDSILPTNYVPPSSLQQQARSLDMFSTLSSENIV